MPASAACGDRHLPKYDHLYARRHTDRRRRPARLRRSSRSAGHGIWERTGHHTFRVFFRIHSFDNLGRLVSITEVTTNPRLIKGDDPETPDVVEPYYLSGEGTNRITNLNPDDGTVINVTEGCNEATSRPILFED